MSTQKNTNANNFSDRIKWVRKANGLNQHDFAAKLQISQGFLSHLETGRNKPTTELINTIANIFEVNGHWLLTGEGEAVIAEGGPQYQVKEVHRKLSADEERLLALFRESGIEDEAIEALEAFIKLPRRKQRIRLGQMLADLEELKDEEA